MMSLRSGIYLFLLLLFLSTNADAITFDKIFFAGDGREGQLGRKNTHFFPDESRIYLRFVYQDGRPGQVLTAHWQIVEDTQGRSGEFATSQMSLEKAADRGQFSYHADEPWPVGHYRVTITDSNNIILEEIDYQVVSSKAKSSSATVSKASDTVIDEQEALPPPFTELYAPTQGNLSISRIFTAGRNTSKTFDDQEAVIYVRFEYNSPAAEQVVDVIWEHLGHDNHSGIGIFARAQITLQKKSGQGQFSFRPKPAGSWLPGEYKVTLLSNSQIISNTQFRIKTTGRNLTAYNEIVETVSNRTSLPPDKVNRLYKQKPSLFSGIKRTLEEIQALESYATGDIESLTRNTVWEKRTTTEELAGFKSALRSYKVSLALLPGGVSPPSGQGDLSRLYKSARVNRSPIQAYGDVLASVGDFVGRNELYTKFLKARGQSNGSGSADFANYLRGKADLFWRNRFEVEFQSSFLNKNKNSIIESMWRKRELDFEQIKRASR